VGRGGGGGGIAPACHHTFLCELEWSAGLWTYSEWQKW